MACHTLRRHAGPAAGPGRAVGPAGRLRCDARVGVAPPNSCRNAGPPQVSASPSGGRSRAARPWWHHFSSPLARCARTTAASQSRKRTARADPDAALLAALKGPAAGPARRLRGGGDDREVRSKRLESPDGRTACADTVSFTFGLTTCDAVGHRPRLAPLSFCTYNQSVRITFDPAKNERNPRLRGLSFERTADLSFDTAVFAVDDRRSTRKPDTSPWVFSEIESTSCALLRPTTGSVSSASARPTRER